MKEFEELIPNDQQALLARGMDAARYNQLMSYYSNGVKSKLLDRPAVVGDGIRRLTTADINQYNTIYESAIPTVSVQKFVPASGAATRMFKFLSSFYEKFNPLEESINGYINRSGCKELLVLLTGKEKLACYPLVAIAVDDELQTAMRPSDYKNYLFIRALLDADAMNYSNQPKAILPFHTYDELIVTPIYEHLRETALYASSQGVGRLHFTVSPEHQYKFEAVVARELELLQKQYDCQFEVSYSTQASHTDVLAVTSNNKPFRCKNGELLFRPGGHGALIHNLSQLDADVIFIKNIDNVIHTQVDQVARYKKALGGLLLQLQEKVFYFLRELDNGIPSCEMVHQALQFLNEELLVAPPQNFEMFAKENQLKWIRERLNRPLRVCGMVKNEGEPGGGPFWVQHRAGHQSLQIVESAQVDTNSKQQRSILKNATHFNPVDIVCGVLDYQGNRFDLTQFVDHNSGFLVSKTKEGSEYKAYELPGLWNGGMAHWNSVFVEVPLLTFNPVKTINDLLKTSHQP